MADSLVCVACRHWNHWHDTPDGACSAARCECPYRPPAFVGPERAAQRLAELKEALRQMQTGKLAPEYIPAEEDVRWARRELEEAGDE